MGFIKRQSYKDGVRDFKGEALGREIKNTGIPLGSKSMPRKITGRRTEKY